MKDTAVSDIRSFIMLGHTGSGKTTLCDAILFKMGLADRMGLVSAGTSMSDFTEEEISRKSSIYAQVFSGVYSTGGRKNQIVMIDSPGVDDFAGQVICSFRAVNAALVAVDHGLHDEHAGDAARFGDGGHGVRSSPGRSGSGGTGR